MRKIWNKIMQSELLPIVWGALLIIIITSLLTGGAIHSFKWMLGV